MFLMGVPPAEPLALTANCKNMIPLTVSVDCAETVEPR